MAAPVERPLAYGELWDYMGTPENRYVMNDQAYTLFFSENTWRQAIKAGCVHLTEEQLDQAKNHPKGYIGQSAGVDCYLIPEMPSLPPKIKGLTINNGKAR